MTDTQSQERLPSHISCAEALAQTTFVRTTFFERQTNTERECKTETDRETENRERQTKRLQYKNIQTYREKEK